MDPARLAEHGLSEAIVEEIRARERRQLELFLRATAAGATALWLLLTVFIYSYSWRQAPVLGVLVAPLLALLGSAIGALPIAVACGVVVLLLHPRHPKAAALERFEAAHSRTRPCDVCILARGDDRPRPNVTYCARCDAWLCPECRDRYDLRAIAALRTMAGRDRR